jgi:glutathione S-transferase
MGAFKQIGEPRMSLKLYFAPGACSFVPHAMLEIAGAGFEPTMVKLHKGEQQTPEYLALNPRGQVPVLVDGEAVITQILAIITFLNDKFPEMKFLPVEALAKAKTLETLAWFNNTVHPTFTHFFMPHKFGSDEATHADLRRFNAAQFKTCLQEIDAMAAGAAPWINGEHIGPLDLYALTLMRWGGYAGLDPTQWPSLWPHANRVAAHPAVARAVERERLQLNVYQAKAA